MVRCIIIWCVDASDDLDEFARKAVVAMLTPGWKHAGMDVGPRCSLLPRHLDDHKYKDTLAQFWKFWPN